MVYCSPADVKGGATEYTFPTRQTKGMSISRAYTAKATADHKAMSQLRLGKWIRDGGQRLCGKNSQR